MANIPLGEIAIVEAPGSENRNYMPALISLAVLYFTMGFITCLNDTLVPFFKKGFALSYSESSLVQVYFFITYGVMSIPSGKIVEYVGYKNGMVAGFTVAAIGALLFFPAAMFHQYVLFLAALFILAIGIVLLQVAANPYITILGPAKTASSRLTLIQGIGSLGTTTAPLFGAYFILSGIRGNQVSSHAVQYPYLGIGGLLIVIAFIVSRMALPAIKMRTEQEEALSPTSGKARHILSFRNLNLGVWAIFAYVGAEVSIGTFLTNYIVDTLKVNEESANTFVAFYWGGMLVGRLLGAPLLKLLNPPVVLNVNAIAAALLIVVSVNSSGQVAIWSLIAIGFFNSIMFATIFSLSVRGLGKFTVRASGLLSTAIAGGAIIPFIQGMVKDHLNWSTAFMVPLVCYTYILFYGIDEQRRSRPAIARTGVKNKALAE